MVRSRLLLLSLTLLSGVMGCEGSGDIPLQDAGTDSGVDGGASDAGAASDQGSLTLGDGFTKAQFSSMFLHQASAACEASHFTYEALIEAAASFPAFGTRGDAATRLREVAAFLANASHETTGGWATAPDGPYAWGLCFAEEVGCDGGGCTGYCAASAEWPCASGQTYHGRGPMQLSWNYNYGQAGDALGEDLLNNPARVRNEAVLAWKTALWFWMTPQAPKPSCHDVMTGGYIPSAADLTAGRVAGFGLTVNIINGGLECGIMNDSRVEDRVGFFRRYVGILGTTEGDNLYCDEMQSF